MSKRGPAANDIPMSQKKHKLLDKAERSEEQKRRLAKNRGRNSASHHLHRPTIKSLIDNGYSEELAKEYLLGFDSYKPRKKVQTQALNNPEGPTENSLSEKQKLESLKANARTRAHRGAPCFDEDHLVQQGFSPQEIQIAVDTYYSRSGTPIQQEHRHVFFLGRQCATRGFLRPSSPELRKRYGDYAEDYSAGYDSYYEDNHPKAPLPTLENAVFLSAHDTISKNDNLSNDNLGFDSTSLDDEFEFQKTYTPSRNPEPSSLPELPVPSSLPLIQTALVYSPPEGGCSELSTRPNVI